MAFRSVQLLRTIRNRSTILHNLFATSVVIPEEGKFRKLKEFKTENNFVYLEDPDTFGTLSSSIRNQPEKLEDDDDIKEQIFLQNVPLRTRQLTTKQYADLIKQYLKYKRLKEAIDVLQVRMLKDDRVKPENYIYNILIGACADVGYTKMAFKLYNDMKRRALRPTGDTYTSLFVACANSPWPANGLKNATHLRELMIEKGIEPNITNYNAMIKAFGRCGDLPTAFRIVDEMTEKKIKIRVHTLNHLLHACISDKDNGLRHAIIVWRKMLQLREKPNIYSFNLMLKCVKDCNLGNKQDIEELLFMVQQQIALSVKNQSILAIPSNSKEERIEGNSQVLLSEAASEVTEQIPMKNENSKQIPSQSVEHSTAIDNNTTVTIEIVNKLDKIKTEDRLVPNLLSKFVNMDKVTALQEIHTSQEKFAVIGGQEDFLKEMKAYAVKPDIKTFTQMLPLIEDTTEAENKLLETMKSLEVIADIDFYNMLIKKRCMRLDYDAAVDVKEIIKKESEFRKKRYPRSKKLQLKLNVMTYGVLALACKTKESAEQLLKEMEEKQLKVNIETLGTLLRHGTASKQFGYVVYIMKIIKQENMQINSTILKHLEMFNDKCMGIIKQLKEQDNHSQVFIKSYDLFHKYYTSWLKDINIEEVLKPEDPWSQFQDNYPETVQRQNMVIKEPKKFYKRNRKPVRYAPRILQ